MRLHHLACLLALAATLLRAEALPCAAPKDALSSPGWVSVRSVPVGTVSFFTTPSGWQGLNQVYASSVATEQRWRALLPWGAATTVEYFRGKTSLNLIQNARPVFYLKASPSDAVLPYFSDAVVRLSKLRQRNGERALLLTRGSASFTQKSLYVSRQDLTLTARRLSESAIEVQPQADLEDGDYLLSLGVTGAVDFEFPSGAPGSKPLPACTS